MRRTAEFDAFGPWIDEVHDLDDVPPLYRGHRLDLDAAHLVLKVPRQIARRDANPDMDLYDHLVVAGADGLTLLSRRPADGGYDVRELPYDRVATVQTGVELLDGRFTLHDVAGPSGGPSAVGFRYNGVSQDQVARLARVVRREASRTAGAGADRPAGPAPITLGLDDLGTGDVALVTGYRELTEHDPDLVVVAAHRRTTVARRTGALRGVMDRLLPATLHAAVVCTRPQELHVLHRRRWFTTGRRPVHSVVHTTVLLRHVTSVSVSELPRWVGAHQVSVTSGSSLQPFPFPEGADTGPALEAVLGQRTT